MNSGLIVQEESVPTVHGKEADERYVSRVKALFYYYPDNNMYKQNTLSISVISSFCYVIC